MHDIKQIRKDPEAFDRAMLCRGLPHQAQIILEIDERRRNAMSMAQKDQARRNEISKLVGQKKRIGENTVELEKESTFLQERMQEYEVVADKENIRLTHFLEALPNILDDTVPDGKDETNNILLYQVGEPLDIPGALEHWEIGENHGMDFERAGKIAGSRFTVLRGGLARLSRALGQFMIDLHTKHHGYEEVEVPVLVNQASMYGTGQLPKFEEDLFKTTDGRYLIPTAEVPLTNYVRDEILNLDHPIRFVSLSNCFRSEAGSGGRDQRGMLRQHQFQKVELVSIVHPDKSLDEHERMTRCAEWVLELLELPYRRMLLCSGDTGFGSTKTYDLEVWLPGQKAWREISSCSNMKDFQGRRMNTRYRGDNGKPEGFVHTLNGSGVAVGRALIAVLENHQQTDSGIKIPLALRPYLGGNKTMNFP